MKSEEISVVYLLGKQLVNRTLTEEQDIDSCFVALKYPYLVDDFIRILSRIIVSLQLFQMVVEDNFKNTIVDFASFADALNDRSLSLNSIFSFIALGKLCCESEGVKNDYLTDFQASFFAVTYHLIKPMIDDEYQVLHNIVDLHSPKKEDMKGFIEKIFNDFNITITCKGQSSLV